MKELIQIQSRLNAPKNQWNKFWKYYYRNCEDIFEWVKPLLKELECILKLDDELIIIWTRYYIKATATLTNKEWVTQVCNWYAREEENKKWMDWSQVTWASSSYARKYALNWLFCIDDAKDSDTKIHEDTKELWEFTEDNLKKFDALKDNFTQETAVSEARKKYKVSEEMAEKIESLYIK